MGPKISVVIPVYNVEPYLRQCLDSIVNQTYRNLEIILVDDGSPDRCGEIVDEYAQRDDRIVVLHKKNSGVGAARNDGIDRASGEWITFVDPDDWCELEYYEQMLQQWNGQNVDILCAGGRYLEYPDGQITRRSFDSAGAIESRTDKNICMTGFIGLCPHRSLAYRSGVMWDKLYRLPFLRRIKLRVSTELHPFEDNFFNFQAFDQAERIGYCSYIGYHYRQEVPTSSTYRLNPGMPGCALTYIEFLNTYIRYRKEPERFLEEAVETAPIPVMMGFPARCYYFHADNPKPYKEIAEEIKELKKEPVVATAIHSQRNDLLSKKQILLKYILRLPWIWPLKLAYTVRHIRSKW